MYYRLSVIEFLQTREKRQRRCSYTHKGRDRGIDRQRQRQKKRQRQKDTDRQRDRQRGRPAWTLDNTSYVVCDAVNKV